MPTLPPATICAKSKGGILGILKTFGWSEHGCYKINTLSDETERPILESTQAFPTILELAQLSQHASTISDLKNETEVPFKIEAISDWICIGTGRYSDGYCGGAYVNHKHSHVVIAHGGTDFTKEFYKDVICTDVGGVFLNREVSQISSAYIFTKIIVNLCSDTQFSISVTGHSLGGWLAQISAFYIEHPHYISQNKEVRKIIEDKQRNLELKDYVKVNKPYHLHTVSFDSPGCRRAFKKILMGYYGSKAIEWRENVDTLDFTVIIAPSNIVNTCGEHVGYVLKLEMPGVHEISWGGSSHWIQLFVNHLSSPQPKLKEVYDVHWGKAVQVEDESEDESIILDEWYIGRMSSCRVNIFSPIELEFLTRTQIILKWRDNESLKTSKNQIFGEETYKGVRNILDSIGFNCLTDFTLNFIVTHDAIGLLDKILLNNLDISRLIKLLRQNRVWLNENEFLHVIRDFPGCRQMVCESECSLYIEKIPTLYKGECFTNNLCSDVRAFLLSGQHLLHINAGRDGRKSRLYMVHLFNCFGTPDKGSSKEYTLFMNISIVQRLNRDIDMTNIFSQTKVGLIVLECDSEVNRHMNDVIECMIANVKYEGKKLIIVTGAQSYPAVENYTLLECEVDLALQFQNLDESSKDVISQSHVEMDGNILMLGKSNSPCGQYLLEDVGGFFSTGNSSDIICDIFDGKIVQLSSGSLPIMAQHYISRTLFQITLDIKKLTRDGDNFSDIIVLSNCDGIVEHLIPEVMFSKKLVFTEGSSYTKECFLKDCEQKYKSRNVHWFKMGFGKSVWQISVGQPCFDYLKNDADEIYDSDLHGLQSNFNILADEPGMGKSAALTKLFLEYRSVQLNSTDSQFNWPVYINLNYYQVELRDPRFSPESAIRFLIKACNLDGDLEISLFRFCLEEIGNMTFFIDSFDEISQTGQDFLVQMLTFLKSMSHSRIRVWIATRNYAKYELEKMLGTISYKFHRIEINEQKQFLVQYWTHNIQLELSNITAQIQNFAKVFAVRAITAIQNTIGVDHTFIGIPLQLVLLALIYNNKFLHLLENKIRVGGEGDSISMSDSDWQGCCLKFSSTLQLYDLFINKKMNIWLGEKFKSDWMDDILRERMNELHSHAAFLSVSSSFLTNSDITIQPLIPSASHEVNRVGFCEISNVSGSNIRFYHQTIAEYFTAKYLVNLTRNGRQNDVISFLKNHYHEPYFKKIRYFLDSLLCTDIPVLENLELFDTKLSKEKDKSLRKLFKNMDWQAVDALGRNTLHYALAYGNHVDGIFWMIERNLDLFHEKDLLGETCLSYLCLSENFPTQFYNYNEYLLFKDEKMFTHLNKEGKAEIARIIEVPVLYSIFCGGDLDVGFVRYGIAGLKLYVKCDFKCMNSAMFTDFLRTTDRHLLSKNLDINMKWLSRCTGISKVSKENFLFRLCLQNSLGKNSEMLFLKVWFQSCLSDDAGGSYELGAEFISACRKIKKLDEYSLTILRSNLPNYYHNAFPYMSTYDEYSLWESCSDIEDRVKMLFVMKNHSFYSIFRSKQTTRSHLFNEVIKFVYRDSDGEFRAALNDGLVKSFHVSILSGSYNTAFGIYKECDIQTKEQIIKDNFECQITSTMHDDIPKLCVYSAQIFKDIIDEKYKSWSLKPLLKIKDDDFQSHFFTLPVTAK